MVARQGWDPERYARNARFVSELGVPLLDLLAARAHERILDLGCGDGELSARLASCGCTLVGVDASPAQVGAARARGIDARVMSGEQLTFDAEFDAVLSNAALHWMGRPDAVITGVWRALRPGGRFVAELGGEGNVDSIRRALHEAVARRGMDPWVADPWYFPNLEEYRGKLEAGGFRVDDITRLPRPTRLPADIIGWLETFAGSFLAALPAPERAGFLGEVRAALEPRLRSEDGVWTADYVRLRFVARKR